MQHIVRWIKILSMPIFLLLTIGVWLPGSYITQAVVTPAPPYVMLNGNYYLSNWYQASRPSGSPTWLNGVAPSAAAAGTNGDYQFSGTGTYWSSLTATTSAEVLFTISGTLTLNPASTGITGGGVWLWDSTNSIIWAFSQEQYASSIVQDESSCNMEFQKFTYNGSGNPSFSSTVNAYASPCYELYDFKLSVSGGTITASFSINGATIYYALATGSVGTISKGGYWGAGDSTLGSVVMDVRSLTVN